MSLVNWGFAYKNVEPVPISYGSGIIKIIWYMNPMTQLFKDGTCPNIIILFRVLSL